MAMNTVHSMQKTENGKYSPRSKAVVRQLPQVGSRGFALLISVIFMSVMLSFGLALAALGYKQQVLASSAISSQYAFYAADAALECALYYDQQLNLFALPASNPNGAVPVMLCDGAAPFSVSPGPWTAGVRWVNKLTFNMDSGKRCADVTVYKPAPGTGTTYIFAQGYDVPCTTVSTPGARFVARGENAHF
jgi:hypothetical protein